MAFRPSFVGWQQLEPGAAAAALCTVHLSPVGGNGEFAARRYPAAYGFAGPRLSDFVGPHESSLNTGISAPAPLGAVAPEGQVQLATPGQIQHVIDTAAASHLGYIRRNPFRQAL